jgi:hypothetical protein
VVSYRFIAIAVALLFVSYATVQSLLAPRQLMPDARMPSFHRIGTSDDPRQNQPNESDGDEVRDSLRRDVLVTANDLRESPCNDYLRDRYIAAATSYARGWLSIAPCFGHCNPNNKEEAAQLERAAKAFKTPFDDRVSDAMVRAHVTDTIREGDFAPDVVRWVASRSRDVAINPMAAPPARKSERERRVPLSCRP